MKLRVCLACLLQHVLDVIYRQMLMPLYHSLSEPSAASSHGVRCLASEHAVIVKEQTAQAIANTAHAYERSGVEAALSEVTETQKPTRRRGGLAAVTASFLHSCYSVSLLYLTSPSFSPVFSHSFSPFCCHSLRKLNPRSPCPRKQPLQSSQSSPQRRRTQSLPPRLILRPLKSRFPVWEGFWLDLMQMDMMRRYTEECRVQLPVSSLLFPSHVTQCACQRCLAIVNIGTKNEQEGLSGFDLSYHFVKDRLVPTPVCKPPVYIYPGVY